MAGAQFGGADLNRANLNRAGLNRANIRAAGAGDLDFASPSGRVENRRNGNGDGGGRRADVD
ncbi:MAG: pentapeptide repeat-containing protein [Planctomycetota bacterium]